MDSKLKTEFTKIHYDKKANGIIFNILKFASLFYGVGSGFKNFLYDKNIFKPKHVKAKVISVGNITTGGVGKTPVVSEIAKYLKKQGKVVAIVSRGYGGDLSNKNINVISDGETIYFDAKMAGDEPFWLANETQVVVITSKNRYEASKYAVEKYGAEVILLDDGFQHRKLYRDLDIVLMDSVMEFGNENLLPAGPLREGTEAFKRVDKFVIVSKNVDHIRAEKLAKIMGKKLRLETFVCKTEPDFIYNINSGEKLSEGESVTAICAIGQPKQFYDFLKNYNVAKTIDFEDHHKYTKDEIKNIVGKIVTTEKDGVKLKEFGLNNIYALKLKTMIDVDGLIKEIL